MAANSAVKLSAPLKHNFSRFSFFVKNDPMSLSDYVDVFPTAEDGFIAEQIAFKNSAMAQFKFVMPTPKKTLRSPVGREWRGALALGICTQKVALMRYRRLSRTVGSSDTWITCYDPFLTYNTSVSNESSVSII